MIWGWVCCLLHTNLACFPLPPVLFQTCPPSPPRSHLFYPPFKHILWLAVFISHPSLLLPSVPCPPIYPWFVVCWCRSGELAGAAVRPLWAQLVQMKEILSQQLGTSLRYGGQRLLSSVSPCSSHNPVYWISFFFFLSSLSSSSMSDFVFDHFVYKYGYSFVLGRKWVYHFWRLFSLLDSRCSELVERHFWLHFFMWLKWMPLARDLWCLWVR